MRVGDPVVVAKRRAAIARAFGHRLKSLREAAGLSVDELAHRIGVLPAVLYRFERGASEPRLYVLVRLSYALDVAYSALLTGLLSDGQTPNRLTPRQRAVHELLSDGQTYAQIAADLHITIETVRSHARQIRHRLGARTSRDLIGTYTRGRGQDSA